MVYEGNRCHLVARNTTQEEASLYVAGPQYNGTNTLSDCAQKKDVSAPNPEAGMFICLSVLSFLKNPGSGALQIVLSLMQRSSTVI